VDLVYNYNLLGEYKIKVLDTLLHNQDIVNLLSNNVLNTSLMYTQVFPCFINPDLTDKCKTFLMLDGFIAKTNSTIQNMVLTFKYFTHVNLVMYKLDGFHGTRLDILTTLIDAEMTKNNAFGIGRFESGDRQNMNPTTDNKWWGYYLQYTVPDFKKRDES
jgi:hypothetical protein